MGTDIDYTKLKSGGYILQGDQNHFTIRLRIPGGAITSEQMISLGKIAKKYGRGELHFTTRQGIQIPWVEFNSLSEITNEVAEVGTPPGSCGPRVRNVMSCVGFECQNALVDIHDLSKRIDEKYFNKELPGKIKIAVTGCPNSCAKPQLNDIGVMGVVKPKTIREKCNACGLCQEICREDAIAVVDDMVMIDYDRCIYCGACIQICPTDANVVDATGYTIFVGGNVGRHPRFAYRIKEFADESTVFDVIKQSIRLFKNEAKPLERFGAMIERIGLDEFERVVLNERKRGGDE